MSRQACQDILLNSVRRHLAAVRHLREQRVAHAAYCSLVVGVVDQYEELARTHNQPFMGWLAETLDALVRRAVRASDWFVPVEGGLFLLVLHGTPVGGAVRAAERLRARVRETHFLYGDVELSFSLSLGVLVIHALDSPETIGDRLGQTVSSILQAGGNRVVVAHDRDAFVGRSGAPARRCRDGE